MPVEPMFDDAFLAGQQEYYDRRAPEYDEWWDRAGRYDHGPEENAAWFRERAEVEAAFRGAGIRGHVLELACGTGNWTRLLVETADRVTALDGSAAMLELNRRRVASNRVEYRQADLFRWEPEATYDGVVMGFWLSHVPPDRLRGFLARVRRALRPGGVLFIADSARDPKTTSPDQPLPEPEQPWLVRRLNDGTTHPIVKVFYAPGELEAALRDCGLHVAVRRTERFFLYGAGAAVRNPE